MKFVEFLNEAEGDFVKLPDLKREFKAKWKMVKPKYENREGKIKTHDVDGAFYVDTEVSHSPMDSSGIREEKASEFLNEIKRWFKDRADSVDGGSIFYFNKGTKKEFTFMSP